MTKLEQVPAELAAGLPLAAGNALKTDPNTPISLLKGTLLRVYRTGDFLTQDFRTDRTNIELDPQTDRVVGLWIG